MEEYSSTQPQSASTSPGINTTTYPGGVTSPSPIDSGQGRSNRNRSIPLRNKSIQIRTVENGFTIKVTDGEFYSDNTPSYVALDVTQLQEVVKMLINGNA